MARDRLVSPRQSWLSMVARAEPERSFIRGPVSELSGNSRLQVPISEQNVTIYRAHRIIRATRSHESMSIVSFFAVGLFLVERMTYANIK